MRRGDAGRNTADFFAAGVRSYTGNGARQDYGEAARIFRLAADKGHGPAQNNLGLCYHFGEGTPKDHVKAARYFRLAADQGVAGAQAALGAAYYRGEGCPIDHVKAAHYYRLAADQGDAKAQVNFAKCYSRGEGVSQNFGKAVGYLRLAADQGHTLAQCDYAQACLHGAGGLPQDYGEGIRYHRLAADNGHPDSLLALGAMLIDDEHVPADVRALDPADPREGARLLARAAQSTDPNFDPSLRLQALELLRSHADKREVVSVCCIGCGTTEGLKQCTRCHTARFCGSACMQLSWRVHKQCCARWAGQGDSQ
ncbi:hypothetical protein T492DRAFT_959196 [Pavlovales sp. CCMP2436]|nr:hypothetical protein T492DRAFT_959196 [Pavlovales sp. CCMP2436]